MVYILIVDGRFEIQIVNLDVVGFVPSQDKSLCHDDETMAQILPH